MDKKINQLPAAEKKRMIAGARFASALPPKLTSLLDRAAEDRAAGRRLPKVDWNAKDDAN